MNVLVAGIVVKITEKTEINDFVKQTLVLKTVEDRPQHYPIDFVGDKTKLLSKIKVGDLKKVSFNLNGREFQDKETSELKYFTSLNAWKIEDYK